MDVMSINAIIYAAKDAIHELLLKAYRMETNVKCCNVHLGYSLKKKSH